MPWFRVSTPITGIIEIDVEADSKDEAIDKAEATYTIKCITEWSEDISEAEVEEVFEVPANLSPDELAKWRAGILARDESE